ncbi:MAG: lysophospholipid acyltransferase family protein [Chitinophagales bacterium]
MMPIVYYLLIRPLSFLPAPVLYFISTLTYFLVYRAVGYRKKVVFSNLKNAFPDKSDMEIERIARLFYRHLCDLIVESIMMFQMSEAEAIKRFKVANPQLLDNYFQQGKSVVIVSAHYNNWEYAALSPEPQLLHKVIGIYTPLKNKFMDNKIKESRQRFGSIFLAKKAVKKYFAENKDKLIAPLFAADQSPGNPDNAYWTKFLNQDTAVVFGPEKFARIYNYPVVFAYIKKVKRGYYEATVELIDENPAEAEHGEITEKHTRLLEKEILEQPEYWLWSHRRWKHKKPENS